MKNELICKILLEHIRKDMDNDMQAISSYPFLVAGDKSYENIIRNSILNNLNICIAFIRLNALNEYIFLSKSNYTSKMLKDLIPSYNTEILDRNNIHVNIDYNSNTVKIKWENLNIPELISIGLNEIN